MKGRFLVVAGESGIRDTIEQTLSQAGWEVRSTSDRHEALDMLDAGEYDVVYLDLDGADPDGMETLRDIRTKRLDQLVVALVGPGEVARGVEATRAGAYDFLERRCGAERILLASRNALEFVRLAGETRVLRARHGAVREFLGRGAAAANILRQVAKVAPTSAPVLIFGESGTGKELLARALHEQSKRRGGPFVTINCAAVSAERVEAELFGSVQGAYTGSAATREGRFHAADGGTLLLGEVCDMSLRVQKKVTRALETGEVQMVGGDTSTSVDVRIVATTSKHLGEEVSAGRFHEDLYHRLNVVSIVSPPLRERTEDIPLLAEAFVREYCIENELPGKTMTSEVVERICRYPWPGNVRELRNQVERMVIMCPGRKIQIEDLSAEIRAGVPSSVLSRRGERVVPAPEPAVAVPTGVDTDPVPLGDVRWTQMSLQEAREQFEHDVILRALEVNDWNVSRTADELGIERTSLHKKMKLLGIQRK